MDGGEISTLLGKFDGSEVGVLIGDTLGIVLERFEGKFDDVLDIGWIGDESDTILGKLEEE